MIKVIFVCTGNICRSPMAEGILRYKWQQLGLGEIDVSSMGTHGLDTHLASPHGISVCAENGIDISGHTSQQLITSEMESADIIFCLEKIHKEHIRIFFPAFADKTFLLGAWPDRPEKRKSNIPDPYGGPMRAYKKIFNRISKEIDYIIPFLQEFDE